jgi:hypothetical protein
VQSALEAEMIRLNRLVKQQVSSHSGTRSLWWLRSSLCSVCLSVCLCVCAGRADRDPGRAAAEVPGGGLRGQVRVTAAPAYISYAYIS